MACTLVTSSATAHKAGIGPKGMPLKSRSSPATMTRVPRLASSLHTLTRFASKNCASSMPTTSVSDPKSRMLAEVSTGVEWMEFPSCDTTFSSSYRVSMAGLKISTLWRANSALFSLRISSSVLPENMEPQMTSILPRRIISPWFSVIGLMALLFVRTCIFCKSKH